MGDPQGQPGQGGLQYARTLMELYWIMREANQEYTTQRTNLLVQKRDLIVNLTDIQSTDGAVATARRLGAIERINQELRYLDAENLSKSAVLDSLPNLLKAESLLPVQSRRDIEFVNVLKQYHGWSGEVTMIGGGPDPWQACMDDIARYHLTLR